MCGIAGIINLTSQKKDLSIAARALSRSLFHRGPDDQNTLYFDNVALIHTRLALLDIQGGSQPFQSPDKRYTLTYNGQIYNFKSIREELSQQWQFNSQSDTEVVLAAYIHWGKHCLTRFNGMFSFFIWDEKKKEGFAARDLLGIKPFVYEYKDKQFVFASEAKAVLATHSKNPIANTDAIIEYLVCPYFSGVETPMFKGLHYLSPGHYLTVNAKGIQQCAWGDYQLSLPELNPRALPNSIVVNQLRNCIVNSVQRCLIADVPIGAYLSGGFDSTLIASLAQQSSQETLKTFTVQFSDQENYQYNESLIVNSDDTPFAIEAAQQLKIDHTLVQVSRDDICHTIKQLAVTNDAIPAWEQEIAQHHLAQSASLNYKAILVGDAADETHYGYQFLLDSHMTHSPREIINRFSLPPLKPGLMDNPLDFFDKKYRALATDAGYKWDTAIERYQATTYLIVKRWLPRLLHNGDIHAMKHSLEARVPFADTELLDVARQIHPNHGYHKGTEKWMLRESVKGLLPETIRKRKKSALPKDQGTEQIYKSIARNLFKSSDEWLSHFLDMKKMNQLCEEHTPLNEQQRALLFRSISLCYWQKEYNVEAQ